MTEKQYNLAKQNGTKFYVIYLKGKTLKQRPVSDDYLEESWIARSWVNSTNVFNSADETVIRYVTEDRIQEQTVKYLKGLEREYEAEVHRSQKKLDQIRSAINDILSTLDK